ncbi:MAG: helix-turn-helix transcriptional regulator, partial [Alphaproteobacteria bacterium]|nr:helix-turn-helix transcriptional regulator [Alphaproteobacteria bacterium]
MSGARYPQFCALARAAEIVGERWTLLAVRELLLGPQRFSDLAARLTDVSPTVLTGRLNALIDSGVVRRVVAPPFKVPAYELTESGRALKPAIYELIRWGGRFLFPMRPDDVFEPDWVLLGLDAVARRTPTPPHKIVLRVTHKKQAASFVVQGGPEGTTIVKGDGPGKATIEAPFDALLLLISTDLPIDRAVADKRVAVEG